MLKKARKIRKKRIRAKIKGTTKCPRLSVFRSHRYIYGQLIDDEKGITVVAARGIEASKVGEEIAQKALEKKIKKVVFDRSGYRYHGKVKALAEAVREKGIKI